MALAALTVSGPALADAPATSAREHFENGYALARDGAFEAAIAEFQLAYATSPHFSVLFNLGQAYGAAGRAVEAAHTLERYLEVGGANVDDAQRRRVSELVAYYRRRIGSLHATIRPAGASVVVDGQPVGTAPLAGPVELSAGLHGVAVTLDGHLPITASVRVIAGETASLAVELTRSESASKTGIGGVEVLCAVPEATVVLDGQSRVARDHASLRAEPGRHELQFSRKGYLPHAEIVTLTGGESRPINCGLIPDPEATGLASLRVEHPTGTRVWADGQPFAGRPLPEGAHVVRVEGEGYESATRTIRLVAGEGATVSILPRRDGTVLERERSARVRNQQVAAYVVGGAAALSGAAAIVLAISNGSRYTTWRANTQAFTESFARDPGSTSTAQLEQLLSDENAIRNRDVIAVGLGVGAGTFLVTSLALFFTAGSSHPTLSVTAAGEPLVGYRTTF